MDNFEILQKLKEENARLEAEIQAIKNGDTLDNIEIIHPEWREEFTQRVGHKGMSIKARNYVAIFISICIIFLWIMSS